MYVTPKYMKKFALNPPCPRPPLAPGQEADPTSLKCGEDYPDEWAKRQAKLAKIAKEAVRKFNEDSAATAIAEASASKPKKPAHKPSASTPKPDGQFLKLHQFIQSPQLLRQNPQHLRILPRAKGRHASLLPQEHLLVPQHHCILQLVPLC